VLFHARCIRVGELDAYANNWFHVHARSCFVNDVSLLAVVPDGTNDFSRWGNVATLGGGAVLLGVEPGTAEKRVPRS
jgi:hypothetical protein